MSQITPSLSSRDTAYVQIHEMIVSGALSPGDPLSERGLSDSLGIGRTPVREAIKALARDGLLDISPMRGTFVRQLSLDDLREIHETRLALEGMAAFLAAERGPTDELRACAADLLHIATEDQLGRLDVSQAQKVGWIFHEAMFRAANNQRLHEFYRNLRAQSGLALQKVDGYDAERTRVAVREHLNIYAAIETRQPAEAQRRAWEHLSNALQARLRVLTPAGALSKAAAAP